MSIVVDQASLATPVTQSSATAIALTTTVAVASGGLIVVEVGWFGTATLSSLSDNGPGLTWTVEKQGKNGSDSTALAWALAPSGLPSGTVITATFSANTVDAGIAAMSFVGSATSSVVGTTVGPITASTAAWSTGSVSIAAGSLLIASGWKEGFGTDTTTPAAGVTEAFDYSFDGNSFTMCYRIEPSAGSYAVGGTWAAADPHVTVGVEFKAATGATPANITAALGGVGSLVTILHAGVTEVAVGAVATATSGDVTANYPTALGEVLTNDILLCDVSQRDNVVDTFPAGWTKKAEANNGTGLRKTIAWKRRAGGDSETSVVVTHTGGAQIIARVHVIRGAIASGDPFEAVGGPTSIAAASTGVFPNVTTLSLGALLFYALGYQDDFATAPAITNAQGLTLTERDSTEVP